ncbi:MAG: hypothetical protein OWQ54_08605 [Sulfolobaceae archaeon]|nr:hypothetical protein [Sulfolobaceae archaeon]
MDSSKANVIPLVVDQSYHPLPIGKQLTVALLSADLERGESFVAAELIGWPLLIKKVNEGKYLIFDKSEVLFSKFTKKVYPDLFSIAEDLKKIENLDDFIKRLEQLRLDEIKSSIEINIPSLINVNLSYIDKLELDKEFTIDETLPEKLTMEDIKTYLNIFMGLCNEINSLKSNISNFVSVVDSVYLKFKERLESEAEEVKKKYSEVIEYKKSEIAKKIEELEPKLEQELREKYDSFLKELIDAEVNLSKMEVRYEAGLVEEPEVNELKKKVDEKISQLINMRKDVESPYLKIMKNEKEFINSQLNEMNNYLSNINSKIKLVSEAIKKFKMRIDKVMQDLDNTERYLNSFYNSFEKFNDDEIEIIIPFIVIRTNKNRNIVIKPMIYKGKAQGMLSRLFKRTDLYLEHQINLSIFLNYLKNYQDVKDNIREKYSQEINEGLKEVEKDGWKSRDDINEFYS